MRRTLIIAAALGSLSLPASALADGTPSTADQTNAAQLCRIERGTTTATREAFAQKYGTNKNKKNAFGKCVSRQAAVADQAEQQAAGQAAKDCKAEQGTTAESQAAFAQKYGTNKNKKNAFGKCVSQKSAEADQASTDSRKSAAQTCATERGTTTATQQAFTDKYGTGKTKRNAFGKCVSAAAKAQPQAGS